MRKTVQIVELIDTVNQQNATCTRITRGERAAVNSFLESILHNADVYCGYWHLRPEEVPTGIKPGIIFSDNPAVPHTFPDDSRRRYYVHRKLQ